MSTEKDDPPPEATVSRSEFAESHVHEDRTEGRTARATDELDEQPDTDEAVPEPPD